MRHFPLVNPKEEVMEDIKLAEVPPEPSARQDFWSEHIARYEQSGLSRPEYCRQNGLKFSTFKSWRYQLNKRAKRKRDYIESGGFVELNTRVMSLPLNLSGSINKGSEYSMRLTYGNYQVELSNHFSIGALRDLLQVINQS